MHRNNNFKTLCDSYFNEEISLDQENANDFNFTLQLHFQAWDKGKHIGDI